MGGTIGDQLYINQAHQFEYLTKHRLERLSTVVSHLSVDSKSIFIGIPEGAMGKCGILLAILVALFALDVLQFMIFGNTFHHHHGSVPLPPLCAL